MSAAQPLHVALRYELSRTQPDWTLPEETLPESQPHDLILDLLKAILLAWVARTGADAQVARNLAVRWDESRPRMGVDPDLCVISPRTPEGDQLESLRLWQPGHTAPLVAIEVVSHTHPRKDYEQAPEKHAAAGARELWVFDPKLAGPRTRGGPFRVQLWSRDADGVLVRTYAGAGSVRSPALGAWLVVTQDGERLRLADDEAGTALWPTPEEAARSEAEAARARLAELEAKLAERG